MDQPRPVKFALESSDSDRALLAKAGTLFQAEVLDDQTAPDAEFGTLHLTLTAELSADGFLYRVLEIALRDNPGQQYEHRGHQQKENQQEPTDESAETPLPPGPGRRCGGGFGAFGLSVAGHGRFRRSCGMLKVIGITTRFQAALHRQVPDDDTGGGPSACLKAWTMGALRAPRQRPQHPVVLKPSTPAWRSLQSTALPRGVQPQRAFWPCGKAQDASCQGAYPQPAEITTCRGLWCIRTLSSACARA